MGSLRRFGVPISSTKLLAGKRGSEQRLPFDAHIQAVQHVAGGDN